MWIEHVPRAWPIELTVDRPEGATVLKLIYRDGDGPWQQAPNNSDGTYALTVADTYEVFAVFEGFAAGVPIDEIEELRATLWRLYDLNHLDMTLTLSTSTPTSVNSVTMHN